MIRPWWERDPAALDTDIKELTEAGFRVHREPASADRIALVAESDRESFRIVYYYRRRPSGPRARIFAPGTPAPGAAHAVVEVSQDLTSAMDALRRDVGFRRSSFDEGCVFVPSGWNSQITGAGGTIRFGRARIGGHAYAVRSLEGSRSGLERCTDDLKRAFPDPVSGLWVRYNGPDLRWRPADRVVDAVEDALTSAHGLPRYQVRRRLDSELGAVVQSSPDAEGRADWVFVRRGAGGEPFVLHTRDIDAARYAHRAPFSHLLSGKRVVLVGCGSVGWTVALELARSGVERFVLYDDDLIQPYNLARLDSYLGFVARTKPAALAEQLQAIAPGIEAEARPFEVGTHTGARVLVEDEPDLLINLTGEEISTDETNIASLLLGRPAIFGWISNGVVAGRIVRVRPGSSACYECVRSAQPAAIHSQGEVPTRAEQAWEGACFNVDAFAAAVSRLAVLTLAREPVSSGNPDHVVLDFGGVVPISREVRIKRDPNCVVCR